MQGSYPTKKIRPANGVDQLLGVSIMAAIKLPQVIHMTGLSRSTIYAYIKAEKFPKPLKVGDRAVAWLCEEIEDWLHDKGAGRFS